MQIIQRSEQVLCAAAAAAELGNEYCLNLARLGYGIDLLALGDTREVGETHCLLAFSSKPRLLAECGK
jgi:hypothetical protein